MGFNGKQDSGSERRSTARKELRAAAAKEYKAFSEKLNLGFTEAEALALSRKEMQGYGKEAPNKSPKLEKKKGDKLFDDPDAPLSALTEEDVEWAEHMYQQVFELQEMVEELAEKLRQKGYVVELPKYEEPEEPEEIRYEDGKNYDGDFDSPFDDSFRL